MFSGHLKTFQFNLNTDSSCFMPQNYKAKLTNIKTHVSSYKNTEPKPFPNNIRKNPPHLSINFFHMRSRRMNKGNYVYISQLESFFSLCFIYLIIGVIAK